MRRVEVSFLWRTSSGEVVEGAAITTFVLRITSDRMTVTEPFGSQVRNAREMYETLHFGINLIREQRQMDAVMRTRSDS